MSGTLPAWISFFAFLLLFVGLMFAEAARLGKTAVTFGKALAFSALSNIIGFAVALFIIFVGALIFFMEVFDGAARSSPVSDVTAWIFLALGAVSAPLILFICKRIFLAVFKIKSGISAWIYSFVSSVLFLIVTIGIPSLIFYLFIFIDRQRFQ